MRWFDRLVGKNRPETQPDASVERRIRDLEVEVEKIGRTQKSMNLEWEEVYDKVTHLMARITKRQKTLDRETARAEASEPAGDAMSDDPRPEPSNGIGTHSRLQEMRRRHGLLPR